nr:mediator of DNA damage checkpoint protein 1-like [Ciona intestinalis]|eukprot:XP_026692424.1 mediator of DNA damage checkpoint protein 1-like [Ciona intestinalis]
MFTGVVDELGEKIVSDLGGHMTDDVLECTHLITDKIRRTVKFMCAVVRGAYILNCDWLKDSKKQWRFLPEEDYELREDHNNSTSSSTSTSLEDQFNFNLHESLEIARSRSLPLFHDLRLHVMKSVLPPPNEMYQIILCGGGEVVKRMPGSDAGVIIIGVEAKKRTKKQLGLRIMSKEFILTGILQQKLDYKKFLLNQDDITTSTSYNNSCGTRATRGARARKTLMK